MDLAVPLSHLPFFITVKTIAKLNLIHSAENLKQLTVMLHVLQTTQNLVNSVLFCRGRQRIITHVHSKCSTHEGSSRYLAPRS